MKKELFTQGWTYAKEGEEQRQIVLPHDAMIHEKRVTDGSSDGGHGYFPGGTYVYEKKFTAPAEWAGQQTLLVFEGVYRKSTVTINGVEAGGRVYGYVPFEVDMTPYLKPGEENIIQVTVDNSRLPNSRWYCGSGIYRPVYVVILPQTHIAYQGVQITTKSYDPAVIRVVTEHTGGDVQIEIAEKGCLSDASAMTPGKVVAEAQGQDVELTIPDARLWSAETPYLYEAKVTLKKEGQDVDCMTETFGIRQVSWDTKGLYINGKKTLLQGGCIHHDNGILGAATWSRADDRRIRLMKENGFNAVRMSHHPASNAIVEACDKYGLYLMDETFDMWYQRKTKYDYGCDFMEHWEEDTKAMVDRDYNHPSVIMYSIGNEVSEPGKPQGVEMGKKIISYIKSLDTTRAVTGGMNLMIMSNYAKGKGQYDDVDSVENKTQIDDGEVKNASGLYNMIATLVGSGMNKAANSDKVDQVTTPILDALDIAGYNYGSGRYPLEGKKHPKRILVGSETFPQDIYDNWEMVKKYPYLIGDFMWTAWDYLGEAGIGAWSYTGGMPFNRPYPFLLGGAGVIDIIGTPDVQCKRAALVWGKEKDPVMGVRPVNHPGVRVSKSVWRGTNARLSYAYRGCDGNKMEVDVFSMGAVVELFINGNSVGRKKVKKGAALFRTTYQSGTLMAVSYDQNGNKLGQCLLESATGSLQLVIEPEEKQVAVGDIAILPVSIRGSNGVVESNADVRLHASVTGGRLLAFGSANPCTEERYDSGSFTTYYGRAMAVVLAEQPGIIELEVSADGFDRARAMVEVVEAVS